jgi:hypothetical protein
MPQPRRRGAQDGVRSLDDVEHKTGVVRARSLDDVEHKTGMVQVRSLDDGPR